MAGESIEVRLLRDLIQWINVGRAPDLTADFNRLQKALEAMEGSAPGSPDCSLSNLFGTDQDLLQRMYVAHLSRCLAFAEAETLRLAGEVAAGVVSEAQKGERGEQLLRLLDEVERSIERTTDGSSPPSGRAGAS